MQEKIVEALVQGGLAGVAVFSLWVNYKLIGNHINHSALAMTELTKVLAELK